MIARQVKPKSVEKSPQRPAAPAATSPRHPAREEEARCAEPTSEADLVQCCDYWAWKWCQLLGGEKEDWIGQCWLIIEKAREYYRDDRGATLKTFANLKLSHGMYDEARRIWGRKNARPGWDDRSRPPTDRGGQVVPGVQMRPLSLSTPTGPGFTLASAIAATGPATTPEDLDLIRVAISRLPARQRVAIDLRLAGKNQKQSIPLMGLSEPVVSRTMKLAVERLKEAFRRA